MLKYLKITFIRKMTTYRDKPFIVICGCTGTGKTKLSIQLAKYLIANNRKAEIINADAMQLYKNLDIITNKATHTEMQGIKHHLIGYLDSTCLSNTVWDYKNKAVELIDQMLSEDKVPILVGGTNYYIHSVLYDALTEKPVIATDTNALNDDSELVQMILGNKEEETNSELNLRSHDSTISNQVIYEHLTKVDPESARKLHPNDRRKTMRALQIYYTCGRTKTDLHDTKNSEHGSGLFHGPIRYNNACIFALNCKDEVLTVRLDDRVDQMIKSGLLDELHNFKLEFDVKNKNQSLRQFSRDYQFGIFQSIGFKEFDEYLIYLDRTESARDDVVKNDLLLKCIEDMKVTTRRYARIQMRWIRNRFVKRANEFAPLIHELDTSDVSTWDETIFETARRQFESYLDGTRETNRTTTEGFKNETIFEYNKCDQCDRVFVDKLQWNCHIKGNKHKKRVESLKKYENKRKQLAILSDQLEELKKQKM